MIEINISKKCQAWGQCVFDAREVFSLHQGERVDWQYFTEDELLDKIILAKSHCPNSAISFRELSN
jgi:ferredoxin